KIILGPLGGLLYFSRRAYSPWLGSTDATGLRFRFLSMPYKSHLPTPSEATHLTKGKNKNTKQNE
ncbi:hypothetical protein, partial [uncultured Rikenella sp.]|uniref:hypothetical protein n=1 Tax=uncultured Rikenella sp. TaxID=368003 RepID=UPI00272991FC